MSSSPWFRAALLLLLASAGSLTADDALPATERPKTRRLRVLFLVRDDCPKCDAELLRLRKPGGVFEAMKSVGWIIGDQPDAHLQIVPRDAVPDIAGKLTAADYPAVAGIDGDEVTRYFKTGCTTPLDAWTFGWLLTGKNERPSAPVPEPVRVATTGNYRLRGNHWSVEGDWNPARSTVLAHLRSPNHASGSAAYGKLETWSLEELRSLHDDLHEQEGGLSSGVGAGYNARAGSSFGGGASFSRPSYLVPKALRGSDCLRTRPCK